MKNILEAPFMTEMIRTATKMYNHGWDERNGGNISLMLEEKEAAEYLDPEHVLRTIPTGFSAPELDGKVFWSAVLRGGIQGALYVTDCIRLKGKK